jgi:hypothetical protein
LWLVVVANSALLVALTVVVAGVLRYLSAIQGRLDSSVRRVSKLELGEKFPEAHIPEVRSERVRSLSDLVGNGQKTMVLLVNDACQSCDVLVRQIAELASRPGGIEAIRWEFIFVWIGDKDSIAEKSSGLPQSPRIVQLTDTDGTLARLLLIGSFPVGMAFDMAGKLESQSAQPGPNWLYLTLKVAGPEQPIDFGRAPQPLLRMS